MLRYILVISLVILNSLTAEAQTVIQCDTLFRRLQVYKSTISDVITVMGIPDSKEEIATEMFAHLSGGGDRYKRTVTAYYANYTKEGIQFEIDQETKQLTKIVFQPNAFVMTAKGIQPTKSNFADVIQAYGLIDLNKSTNTPPNIQGWVTGRGTDNKRYYTLLCYWGITFVSYGRWNMAEGFSSKQVDEIWLVGYGTAPAASEATRAARHRCN
ncbi:hypothetical protein LRS06_01880 [Hymenobacter sp. J193]|uniref:hypothetical protein n=1 Tax=Hymenobacter sp. J193 TaxID=2898429 RepID=UPI002151216C|nr:hypothetical protein [Hymenobacter sp. J193]MCR5886541.1 hypothetical protein [Hymenobacter sp. J193]